MALSKEAKEMVCNFRIWFVFLSHATDFHYSEIVNSKEGLWKSPKNGIKMLGSPIWGGLPAG